MSADASPTPPGDPDDTPILPISAAARLAGLHPQTLRQYDRSGLVIPTRVSGNQRRYSQRDVARLQRIAELSTSGMPLDAVALVIALEAEVESLRVEVHEYRLRYAGAAVVRWEPDDDPSVG